MNDFARWGGSMEPQETRFVDKSTWGDGPWQDEPDRVEWRSEGTPRLAMLIVRGGGGALCGYVGVPEGHPWHGKSYQDVDSSVHGGITYSAPCHEAGKICHVPLAGESETVWWLGFDCGHSWDIRPQDHARYYAYASYKSLSYVRSQVERLARQAQRVAKGLSPAEEP